MELLTVLILRIQNIVQCDEVLGLVHSTGSYSSQFLHVGSDTKEQSHVYTEGSDVGTSLTADPEDTEVAVIVELDELGLVDGSDTELSLDGRNQGRALEEGTSEELEDAGKLCLATGNLVVESHDGNILLSGTLLGLDQSCGTVDANDEASGNFGIESTTVASLLDAKHALHPSNDFVGGGVGRFVQLGRGNLVSIGYRKKCFFANGTS